jgi:hypothetical protein
LQVGLDELEFLLVARLALERQALRIAPVHARQIDVRVRAEVDPARLRAGLRRDHAELDRNIRIARGRIALFDDFRAVRIHLVTLLHRHVRLVDARERDRRIVGRPPVTGVAVHLLVGDELGHAVADYRAAVVRELGRLAASKINRPQVAVADEADVAAARGKLRVGRKAFAVRELAHCLPAGLREVDEVELAAEREQ